MAVILKGASREIVLNNMGWGGLLRLAFDNGWKPRGTLPPTHWKSPIEGEPWHSWNQIWNPADYFSSRGQLVTTPDAAALGQILASLVDDLPNHDPDGWAEAVLMPGFPASRPVQPEQQPDLFSFFGGSNKAGYLDVVALCSEGSFAIW